MNRTQNIKGFTIIEVVLVLAIAGLIFLMVFIALPALQAGQRDTARRSDVSNVASAVTSYVSSNRGNFPAANATSLDSVLGAQGSGNTKSYNSLSNNISSVTVVTGGNTTIEAGVSDGVITVYTKMKCNPTPNNTGTTSSIVPGTARQFAVITKLEGGSGTGYCL